MSAERYDYRQYEGLPKEERRKRITDTKLESLETRRFLLSTNPELKERIKKLHKVVAELKKQYPEIISLNLFGSLTKGYANTESDFDVQLFIDMNKEPKPPKPGKVYQAVVNAIEKSTEITKHQLAHVFLELINPNELSEKTKKCYFSIDTTILYLFLLSTSRDINQYRAIVLNTLESMGKDGQTIWESIMEKLWILENNGLPEELKEKRKKLYPQTIAEGRKVFLQES